VIANAPLPVYVRIPGWASAATVFVNEAQQTDIQNGTMFKVWSSSFISPLPCNDEWNFLLGSKKKVGKKTMPWNIFGGKIMALSFTLTVIVIYFYCSPPIFPLLKRETDREIERER
jgi:hypothetical protein